MQIERRALYNLLKMNWQLNPDIEVEAWQIDNYRGLPLERLFDLLKEYGVPLDRSHFLAYSNDCDSPEQLSDTLTEDLELTAQKQDQIYLVVFELWRRLVPEKLSLSVFCDELDFQINLYDHGKISNMEALQDAIANLQDLLDENVDQGGEPHEVFETISSGCAHDIETFLYDFIAEQIDIGNFLYADELLDAFTDYVEDAKWFDFLRSQVLAASDISAANILLKQLVEEGIDDPDVEFYLELLSFMSREGDKELFFQLLKRTIPLIDNEEDFQDLLTTCADFYHYLDLESNEQDIQAILQQRSKKSMQSPFDKKDPDLTTLLAMIENKIAKL